MDKTDIMTIQLADAMTNSYGHLLDGRDAFKLMRVVGGERKTGKSNVDEVMVIVTTP